MRAAHRPYLELVLASGLLSVGAVCAAGKDAVVSVPSTDPYRWQLAPGPVVQPGQSATQLPDGRWLLLGGEGADKTPTAQAGIVIAGGGRATPVGSKLEVARSGHTATLLPNGKVLVLGGVDAAGAVVEVAEQFDPAIGQFQVIGNIGLISRTGHSATLLANGLVLIAGGSDRHGELVTQAELYNPATGRPEPLNATIETARAGHVAALLPDSDVLLWGGTGSDGGHVDGGEVYSVDRQDFGSATATRVGELAQLLVASGLPGISKTMPASEEASAALDRPLTVQFTQRMRVASLNSETVTLIGPQGAVPVKVVSAEQGLLLFVTPAQELLPASRYTLFIKGGINVVGQALPFTAIGFGTAQLGSPDATTPPPPSDPGAAAPKPGNAAPGAHTAKEAAPHFSAGSPERLAIDTAETLAETEAWLPDTRHFKGDWRANRAASPLATLPLLNAAAGATALAGRVLTLHGRALPGVTLSVGDRSAQTDATGRFLLTGLAAGEQVLTIDGASVRRGQARYGLYQVRVAVKEHETNRLGYTIWSPVLDPQGDVTLHSPTAGETVVTTPRIPGLELRIPAGTVIRDRNGKIVTKLNITAIPTDRPPFPLPNTGVPVYFTIQPGGARLTGIDSRAFKGARLIYPNFSGAAAGTRIEFWNYDPGSKGWYIYGRGSVSTDGKQVLPDAGVVIYELTGAMVSVPTNAPSEGPPPDGCRKGDPVDCFTGLFLHEDGPCNTRPGADCAYPELSATRFHFTRIWHRNQPVIRFVHGRGHLAIYLPGFDSARWWQSSLRTYLAGHVIFRRGLQRHRIPDQIPRIDPPHEGGQLLLGTHAENRGEVLLSRCRRGHICAYGGCGFDDRPVRERTYFFARQQRQPDACHIA
jgi:hypothetical protein